MQKDYFGFKTQGENYHEYRPEYPQEIIQMTHQGIQYKQKYLDVGTGTGQLLFKVAPFFQKSVGTDPSQKMINACKKNNHFENIEIIQTDCLDTLDKYQKFDLITVAQALHWFPVSDFINIASTKLLRNQGRLVVIGYYRKGLFLIDQKNENVDVYSQYYETIKQCSKFDQKDLYEEYPQPKYSFKSSFNKVDKQIIDYKLQMSRQNAIGYLMTYSLYNVYKQKFPNKPDPIEKVRERLKAHEKVTLETRYFVFRCQEPQTKS